jgi:hypothetical protein
MTRKKKIVIIIMKRGMVAVHYCNPSTLEVESRELRVGG